MLAQAFTVDALILLHSYYKIYFQTVFDTLKNEAKSSHIIELNRFLIYIPEFGSIKV